MVARATVQNLDVDVGARSRCKTVEEVVHQFCLQVAHHPHAYFQIDDGVRPPAEIDGGDRERFVHGHHEVAGAVDAFAIAECLEHGFAENDADVFDGVMLVDVEVAGGGQCQIEATMSGKQLEHVVEEANAGPYFVPSASVDRQRSRDLRFRRVAIEPGGASLAHRMFLPAITDSSASIATSV